MKFTAEEDNYIRETYLTIPAKRISKNLGRSESSARQRMKLLGLTVPAEIVLKFRSESQFSKGSISFNKGKKQTEFMTDEAIERTKASRFKKGNMPHNTKYDGHERITKDGYIEIRVSKGNYRLKHRVEWDDTYGPIPEGYILACLSDDKTNTTVENWEIIHRIVGMNRNSAAINLPDVAIATYLSKSGHKTDKELRKVILKLPDLITAKRTQLLINRKIKSNGKEQNL